MARPTTRSGSRHPYARKVVPKDVRGVLGRTEFKRPLHGATQADIRRLHAEAIAEWEAEITAARAKLQGNVVSLSARQIAALCGEWYREQLAEHEDEPGSPIGWDVWLDRLTDHLGHEQDEEPPEYEPDAKALAEAEALLRSSCIAADAESIARFAVELFQTKLAFGRTMLRRAEGDWGPDRTPERFPAPQEIQSVAPRNGKAKALTFTELVAAWATENQPSAQSCEKWDGAFRSLAASVGHDDPRRVTADDVRKWKAKRIAAGKSLKTVADGIGIMRSTFNWAIRNQLLSAPNPFAGMSPKVTKRGPSARDGFTDEEATRILAAARQETGWRRWLPWLLAFSGARVEEIAELRLRDVRKEEGVWILDIVPTAARTLKTTGSQRMIPVHPALLAEGFLDYIGSLPPDGPLFPDLAPGRYGSRGSTAAKNHSRWVRNKVGITDKRKAPAHSWRHRMEDQLRIARIPAEAQDAITGRDNPRNAGAGYGRGFRGMPDETLKELSKVRSPLGSLAQ